jgi:hypothetical protein
MKNQTRQIIKNVIEENAVAFKENASKVLYAKVGKKLEDQYKAVAQNLMRPKQ